MSVLEHIEQHSLAIKNMFSLLNPGGHLIVTCPFQDSQYVRIVYELPDSDAKGKKISFITQSFSKAEVDLCMKENNASLVEQEYWKFVTGKFWSCGDLVIPPQKTSQNEPHQLSCLIFKKN